MKVVLEKVEHGPQLGLGEMTICLGNADQDIHQEKNEPVMALGLGLCISCGPTLDITGKAEKGRKENKPPEQTGIDKDGNKVPHSLPATSGQQEEDKNQKTTAAARLVAVIAVLALHEEGKKKVVGLGGGKGG